ncbi:MAG: formylglycine-generating enzyme family protein [Cyanobacteria bacterium P01_D01_bin.36]
MKRRKFFQYAGLSSVCFSLATATHSFAAPEALGEQSFALGVPLETFEFNTTTVDKAGNVKRRRSLKAQFYRESLSKASLEMVAVIPEASSRKRVTLSPYFVSKYPVTQSQWLAVATLPKVQRELALTPAHFRGSDFPVESISWVDAVEFCDRLTQLTGRQYQLPTEAQWEYACRAGTQTPFSTGETITSKLADYVGTYAYKAEPTGRYRQSTLPVGEFPPNAFGLHDMHGNVWEWCTDRWHAAQRPTSRQGQNWITSQRTIKGGSWLDTPDKLRSVARSGYVETGLNRTIGFRVVAT